jgi:hypothetical protein
VRTEQVPWARPNARHTTDFENVAAWLAQRMDKASIARLLRCSWEAVDAIVTRVVADHLDDARLDRLYRIGPRPGGRTAAKRSRISAFANLVRRIEKHATSASAESPSTYPRKPE